MTAPRTPPRKKDRAAFLESTILQLAEQEQLERIREALIHLFPAFAKEHERTYLEDYARIVRYLMDRKRFCSIPLLEAACKTAGKELMTEYTAAGRTKTPKDVSVSKLLRKVMSRLGFSDVAGVYFVGDAGDAFGRAVGNKMLFVDGISFVHGEFTHTIQWLYVHYHFASLKEAGASPEMLLTTPVADLYQRSITYRSDALQAAEAGGNPVSKTATVWDFCVDCFKNVKGGVNNACDLVATRFSDGFRSPANLQEALLTGELRATVLGELLTARYARLRFQGQSLRDRAAEKSSVLQDFYTARAAEQMQRPNPKAKVIFPGAPGAIVPDPLPPGPATPASPAQLDRMAQSVGNLFTPQEVAALNQQLQKAGQKGPPAAPLKDNDLEGLWLYLHRE
jgi:hypothetical protein